MFDVYILKSRLDGTFYIGQTHDVASRVQRHNAGSERYTRNKIPWDLFWSCKVVSRSDAMGLEKKLKNMKSRRRIIEYIEKHRDGS